MPISDHTPGATRYWSSISAKSAAAAPKSSSREPTCASGMISRGKYVLVTMFRYVIRLIIPELTEFEKKNHGTSAAYANSGYGAPPASILPEPAEHEREHQHRRQRLGDGPAEAEERLAVAALDLAAREVDEQLPVRRGAQRFAAIEQRVARDVAAVAPDSWIRDSEDSGGAMPRQATTSHGRGADEHQPGDDDLRSTRSDRRTARAAAIAARTRAAAPWVMAALSSRTPISRTRVDRVNGRSHAVLRVPANRRRDCVIARPARVGQRSALDRPRPRPTAPRLRATS